MDGLKLEMDSVCRQIAQRLKDDYKATLMKLKVNTTDVGKEHGMTVYTKDVYSPVDEQEWECDFGVGTEDEWTPTRNTDLQVEGYENIGDIHAHPMDEESKDGFSAQDLRSLSQTSKIAAKWDENEENREFLYLMGLVMKPYKHEYKLQIAVGVSYYEIRKTSIDLGCR